jgi:epoxyqueuosine reductase
LPADSLTQALKTRARQAGFGLVGVCPAVTPAGLHRFHAWLDAGYAGEMQYLAARREAYAHPRHVLDGACSVVMLGMQYRTAEPVAGAAGQGRISRYAWGAADYHDVIHARLRDVARWLAAQVPGASVRGVVDTAPLLEREFARLAGLGWIGKNTMLTSSWTTIRRTRAITAARAERVWTLAQRTPFRNRTSWTRRGASAT